MNEHSLVFGDDGSAGADAAWEWVASRRWTGWHARVLTAEFPEPWGRPELREISQHTHPRRADTADFVSLTTDVVAADPRLALSQSGADLLVVGEHGRGLLKALHVGSTAAWLMQCPRPPLVIARTPSPSRVVMACVDGSVHAREAVRVMTTLPWVADRRVVVVGVEDPEHQLADEVASVAEALRSQGYDAVEHLIAMDPGVDVVSIRERLLAAIHRLSPELVVMGTQGRTGLARVWVGSVASGVAHRAPCSVLMTRLLD